MAKRYVTGDKHVRSVFKQLGRSLNNAISDVDRFANRIGTSIEKQAAKLAKKGAK